MPFDRILVGVDPTTQHARALIDRACSLAGNLGVVRVVHVQGGHEHRASTLEQLDALVGKREGGPRLELVVRAGDAAEALIDAARQHRSDTIVIGTSRHGPFARLVHGSVTDEVVRKSHVPCLVVPNVPLDAETRDRAGCAPSTGNGARRVLIAIDFSEPTLAAIRAGVALAKKLDLPFEAVHVTPSRTHGEPEPIAELVRLTTDAPSIAVRVLDGATAAALADYATARDVIVCGTRAPAGFALFRGGSVALDLLQQARATVLVVGPEAARRLSAPALAHADTVDEASS